MVKLLAIFAVALACLWQEAEARDEISGPVAAEVLRVVDGDTLLVEARPWPQQRMEVFVRIRGIDAAELHSQCASIRRSGVEALEALKTLTAASPAVQLVHISGDKYFGRIVADVVLQDGHDVGEELLLAGLADPYDGGHKPKPICGAE